MPQGGGGGGVRSQSTGGASTSPASSSNHFPSAEISADLAPTSAANNKVCVLSLFKGLV